MLQKLGSSLLKQASEEQIPSLRGVPGAALWQLFGIPENLIRLARQAFSP